MASFFVLKASESSRGCRVSLTLRRRVAQKVAGGVVLFIGACCVLSPALVTAQALTGSLIGTVKDAEGGVLRGALVRLTSPALIGGQETLTTNEKGQLRFPILPPGDYLLDIELQGFHSYHEAEIRIGAGATIERTAVLQLAGVAESVVVEGAGSRIEARDPGFGTRFGPEDVRAIPTRRNSMFDFIKAAPGISPTAPSSGTNSSGTNNTISAFGSSTNENHFLFDGTNFTCPCNGVARAEPGIDFIQEVQVQSVGASAEFGNAQGAVINVVTRQGSARFLYDASYYAQAASLTSQPVLRPFPGRGPTGYERVKYRDMTTNLGGPVVRDRVWFFTGYQYLRDYDSQPGADPAWPRTYEQNKLFVKITSKLTPGLHLEQSLHYEHWVNPMTPTFVTPFEATNRLSANVPAITFGHLTHMLSSNTLWDVRVGRFVYMQEGIPSTGDLTAASHFDRVTGVTSRAPSLLGPLTIARTTGKATLSHYQPGLWGKDQQWKVGTQIERGGHHAPMITPGGTRYVDNDGQPFQAISRAPSQEGGGLIGVAAFASDAITFGDRLTISAGVRFDHNRAFSPDVHVVNAQAVESDAIIRGAGTLYTWNIVSPRLGVTTKLSGDGRTMLRASYGRFSQGVLTGEIGTFHPGVTPITTTAFESATGGYTRLVSVVDPRVNLRLDPDMRAPRTDEYSVGVDREIGRRLAVAAAYVHKDGANFIGWTDIGGQYGVETRSLPDGRSVPVFVLLNDTAARRFFLTNQKEYSLTYNGLVMLVEKRRSQGWQAFASYTLSKTTGLLPSSGTNAAGAQVSTVSPPPTNMVFGRDPNDLTNAAGLLPNDRPHIFRMMGGVELPRTGVAIAATLQYFRGKPWAGTTQITLPQGDQRVQLESRGSRRLSSQSLLDVRISRSMAFGKLGRVELMVDVLNALNETAEEGLATDNLFSPNFGQPTVFVDPRRAMLSARLNLGR
jgi:TonB dependent receptor-like, beta-barrel/Carboxypeptidase regulatory-like domain